jgi:hypothetical protein
VLEAAETDRAAPGRPIGDAFLLLAPERTAATCDHALLARAVHAAVVLLDDTRIVRGSDAQEYYQAVRDDAIEFLDAMTGEFFGRFREHGVGALSDDVEARLAEEAVAVRGWRAWWDRAGADVETWLARGQAFRTAKAADQDTPTPERLLGMRFETYISRPVETWDPSWPAPEHLLESVNRLGPPAELKQPLPPTLRGMTGSRFFRAGDQILRVTAWAEWDAWHVIVVRPMALSKLSPYALDRNLPVWPPELGELGGHPGPALDATKLLWLEANAPELMHVLMEYPGFDAWVLDGEQVRRVSLH